MNQRIDELSKLLWNGSDKAFQDLEQLRVIVINLKITLAHLQDNPDVRALNQVATIIESSIKNLEQITYSVKEIAKEIGIENKGSDI